MKKFLLSSLLGVFFLGFGGISMAYTNVQYFAEEGASTPCYTDYYGSSAKNLMDISEISADDCARPAGKQFAGWKVDGSPCDGWEYKKSDYYIAGVNNMVYPAGTNVHCSKSAQHINAYPQRVDNAYDLWIGGVQVTNENQNDVLGDGKVSFNPANSTLSFNNATLSDYRTIWVANDPNYNNRKAAAITTKLGNLVISGDVSIEANAYSIYAINDKIDNGGNLTINGNFKINGEMYILGNLNVIGGSITPAITGWNANGAIYCYSSITFGSNLSRIEIPRGIHAASGITIEQPLEITSPVNGQIEYDGSNYLPYSIGNYSTTAIIQPVQEITNINISGIVDPVLGEQATVEGLTITSTPEGVVHLGSNPAWRVTNGQTHCTMGISCDGSDWRTDYFSYQESVQNKKYYIYIPYTLDEGYVLADNVTINTNGDGTVEAMHGSTSDYIKITYNASDIPASAPVTPTQISSISITGITLPVAGAVPTTEGIRSLTTGITVEQSNNGAGGDNFTLARVPSIGRTPVTTAFTAGQTYRIVIPFSIADGYELAYPLTIRAGDLDADENIVNTTYQVFGFSYTATEPASTTYTVTWKNGNTVLETDENVVEGATPSYDGETPTKPATSSYTYTFSGWSKDGTNVVDLTTETITDNTVYTALFNETAVQQSSSSSSSSGGGGGGGKTVTKTDNKTDETKAEGTKQDENKSEEKQEGNTENPENTQNDSQKVLEDGLTQEFHDAYDFAHKNGITTMPSAKEANMQSPLTRIAMAKMLSNYAINVLGKKPANKVVPKFPDIDEKLNEDYGGAADLAYQLGIMGIGIENFRPFDPVPRAEFVTALSRMLYGIADGDNVYYETHMKKLKEGGIITNDNPNLQEVRGYVMIMLMRSAK